MKQKKVCEVADVRRSIVGMVIIQRQTPHPMLSELCGSEPDGMLPALEDFDVAQLEQEIREVAPALGITFSICGRSPLGFVLRVWMAPKPPKLPDPPKIFAGLRGLDRAHWSVTDFYDEARSKLLEALACGQPFDTGYYSCKKELHSARIMRVRPGGEVLVYVSASCDDPEDLAATAFWEAAGQQASSGMDALMRRGLSEDEAEQQIEALAEVCGPTEATEQATLRGLPRDPDRALARITRALDDLAKGLDQELEATYQDLVFYAARKLRKLKA